MVLEEDLAVSASHIFCLRNCSLQTNSLLEYCERPASLFHSLFPLTGTMEAALCSVPQCVELLHVPLVIICLLNAAQHFFPVYQTSFCLYFVSQSSGSVVESCRACAATWDCIWHSGTEDYAPWYYFWLARLLSQEVLLGNCGLLNQCMYKVPVGLLRL